MNALKSEENDNNTHELPNYHSNQEKVSKFPYFEIQPTPKSLFSREKSQAKSLEKLISLGRSSKTPINLHPVLFEIEENLAFTCKLSSFFKVVRITLLCKAFIQRLKEKRSYQIAWERSFPLEILHDKAYFPKENSINKRNFMENLNVFKRFPRDFLAKSLRNGQINALDLVNFLIVSVVLVNAPLKLAKMQNLTLLNNLGNISAICLQSICFFSCFTAIISGFFEKNRNKLNNNCGNVKEIRKFQIKYVLSLDFLAKLSLLLYFLNETCALLFEKATFFVEFRIFTCLFVLFSSQIFVEKLSKFEYFLQFSRKTQEKISFFRLLLLFFLIIHNFSCFYLYLSRKGQENAENWRIGPINSENEPFSLYLSSFSLILKGITSIQSKISSPLVEKVFFIIFFVVFWCLLLLNSGKICRIIKKLGENRLDNFQLMSFLGRKDVKYPSALQIQRFLNRKYCENQENEDISVEKWMKDLPLPIKSKILNEKYSDILKTLPFLQHFSADFREKFLQNLEERRFSPNEIAMKPKEEPCFLLIEQGSVNISIITDKNEEKVIKTYKKNEVYGEKFLFSLNLPLFSVVAKEFTTVKAMKKSEFLKIVRENRADYEKYCFLRDKVHFCAFSSGFLTNCEVCKGTDHRSFACLSPHFSFTSPKFLRNFRSNYNKKMHFSGRKGKRTCNSLKSKRTLSETLVKHKIIPPIPIFLMENKSILNETSSIELSDTSLGQMLRKKSRKITGNLKEKPNEISTFTKNNSNNNKNNNSNNSDNSDSYFNSEIYYDNDSSNLKKPELLLEHISEESDIHETFTVELDQATDSINIKSEEPLSFDQVSEFAHYFPQNNVSSVLLLMKNGEKTNISKKNKTRNKKINGKIKNLK